MKNALKTFITDKEIWINPKGVAAYFEQNHANIIFYSNERMPVVLEHDDRRHCVIWTPPPKPDEFYIDVTRQIATGGVEAFYHYLLGLDLGDFNEHSKPPMTDAKQELIDLGKPPVLRFYDEWSRGEIDGLPFLPVRREDLYAAFKAWCLKNGCRPSTSASAIDRLSKITGVRKELKWIGVEVDGQWQQKQKVFYFSRLPGKAAGPGRFRLLYRVRGPV